MEKAEHLKIDPTFYDRADAHIHLSNSKLSDINPGKVSASMMYATARFNAYVSWIGFQNAADMAEKRDQTVRYFVEQYQAMLEENLDDYIANVETTETPSAAEPANPPKPCEKPIDQTVPFMQHYCTTRTPVRAIFDNMACGSCIEQL